MIKGLRSLKNRLARIETDLNTKVKAEITTGLGNVIMQTPVHFKDGGRARNNWYLGVGKAGNQVRKTASKSGSASFRSLDKMPDYVLDQKLFFYNNLPYINMLEYGGYKKNPKQGTMIAPGSYQKFTSNGFSLQAPQGMARVNLRKIAKRLRK